LPYLETLENINLERKQMQDDMLKIAEDQIDTSKKFLFVADEDFHEGIV